LDHWPDLMWLLRKQYSSPKMLFCPPQTPYCCIICHLRCWNLNKKQAKHRPQLVIRKIGAFLQSLKKISESTIMYRLTNYLRCLQLLVSKQSCWWRLTSEMRFFDGIENGGGFLGGSDSPLFGC
jgi:hypothetical protein